MTALWKIYSFFGFSKLHSNGIENGKNESKTSDICKNQKVEIESECKDHDKIENFIFLLPPVILLLAILIMYILYKIFY